jgi:CRP-like cAMP-binding protein
MSLQPSLGNLNPDLLQALQGMKPVQRFAKGATLFQQGTLARGVFVGESGEVRVLLPAGQSQRQLLEVAGPGTILGLSESMAGEKHRITAVGGAETMAVFIPSEEFLEFLHQHCEFCMQVVQILSEDLHGLYHKFRSITAHPGRPRQRPLDEQLN